MADGTNEATGPHDRSARVLDPAYVLDVESNTVEELRSKHAECLELETEVSYVRRLTQARIDILEAEIRRRSTGGSLEDLIQQLPQILADPGPHAPLTAAPRQRPARPARRGPPAPPPLPIQMAPEQDSEWAPDLQRFDGV